MHANAALIDHFYASFAKRDAAAMAACYAPDAHFRDPIFDAQGRGCRRHVGDALRARPRSRRRMARRAARTTPTGVGALGGALHVLGHRAVKVHNIIDSRFTFRDGLIVTHTRHVRPVAMEPDGARRRRACCLMLDAARAKKRRSSARGGGADSRRLDGATPIRRPAPNGCHRVRLPWQWHTRLNLRSRTTARRASASC